MENITVYHGIYATGLGLIGFVLAFVMAAPSLAEVFKKKRELMSKLFVLFAMISSPLVYCFLIAMLIAMQSGLMVGSMPINAELTSHTYFYAGLSIGLAVLFSELVKGKILQAKVRGVLADENVFPSLVVKLVAADVIGVAGLVVSVLLLFGVL